MAREVIIPEEFPKAHVKYAYSRHAEMGRPPEWGVLVFDDIHNKALAPRPDVLEVARSKVWRLGWSTFPLSNGPQAIEFMHNYRPDAVIAAVIGGDTSSANAHPSLVAAQAAQSAE